MRPLKIIIFILGIVVLTGAGALLLPGCKHEPVGLASLDTVCFETQVLPIFTASCGMTGCHSGSTPEAGFDATSYAKIMRRVTPGNAWKSDVYKVISSPNDPNMMPPSPHPPLTKQQRLLIEVWIEQGAHNTSCSSTDTTTTTPGGGTTKSDTVCFTQDILPILVSSCGVSGCHDAGTHQEGYVLTDYASLMKRSGGIVPGSATQSSIYQALLPSAEERMPRSPYSTLTTDQIALFRKWIDQGALNSDCAALKCDTTGTVSFSSQVMPLMTSYCKSCHGTNYSTTGGGINLSDYAAVKNVAETTRSNTSILIGAIRHASGFAAMPLSGGSLSRCDLRTIELWVEQGKLNN